MTKILDYGLGNIRAFLAAYKTLGIQVSTASTASELDGATHLILPGVGAFDDAVSRFEASGLGPAVTRLALEEKRPLLGVCVGMQMLGRGSKEGALKGLGWIDGEVKRFEASVGGQPRRVPHMGWNDVRVECPTKLFDGLDDARFYFLHSYYFGCDRPADVLATSHYHEDFVCAVASGNVYGVQFHPEKSHQWGCRLLKNFSEM
jgi:imidazole glycerol-phosphate synthase subunit HisH